MPLYEDGELRYAVDDVELEACPVSVITPQSRELVNLVTRAHHAYSQSGAAFGGADSRKWPGRWFDAVTVIEQQKILEHNARLRAEVEAMKRKK